LGRLTTTADRQCCERRLERPATQERGNPRSICVARRSPALTDEPIADRCSDCKSSDLADFSRTKRIAGLRFPV
jgi:hypothetical protein